MRRLLLALLAAPSLAACHDSGGSGGTPVLTNLGLGAAGLRGRGELWVAEVDEFAEGQADRNGDGDTGDVVVSVLDLEDGSLRNLALARSVFPLLAVGDVLIALGVPEASQGDSDLNGDGDADDLVLHVYDAGTRTTTNTGLALGLITPAVGAGAVAFAVSEAGQGGVDLDGSGAAVGNVLHVYDARTGLATNAQRNVTSPLFFHDHAFGFTTDEASAGAELNGDGDQDDDAVFQLYDLVVGGIESVPLALAGFPVAVAADDWYLLVDEAAQGTDLNDDLDLLDVVLLAVEPHLGTVLATGITSVGGVASLSDGQRIATLATEGDGGDRNQDGDSDDSYAALIHPGVAPTFIADLPALAFGVRPFELTPSAMGFLVSENEVGDLNANGVDGEAILFTMDGANGALLSTDLEALSLDAAGGHLVFARFEQSGSIQEDRNGDGDVEDLVLSYWNTLTNAPGDTDLASAASSIVESSSAFLFQADEATQGTDLNGDGDALDFVWVLHDLAASSNLILAASGGSFEAGLLEDGRGVLLVSESSQGPAPGTDLNGDGDTLDQVLHTFRAP